MDYGTTGIWGIACVCVCVLLRGDEGKVGNMAFWPNGMVSDSDLGKCILLETPISATCCNMLSCPLHKLLARLIVPWRNPCPLQGTDRESI